VLWSVDAGGEAKAQATGVGRPRGLAPRSDGTIVVTDVLRHDVRVFNSATMDLSVLAGNNGCPAFADGPADKARFNRPYGAATLSNGDVVVADMLNHRIRLVKSNGDVSTIAGDGTPDMIDGPVAKARFDQPEAIAVDGDDNIYVSEIGNHRIRRITKAGVVETIAGSGQGGFKDGSGKTAQFFGQEGLVVSKDGKKLYVADGTNGEAEEPYNRVRVITLP
jgi:DNA-binding beta-propeller fold protein YncE